jgi:hypoxanthine phosphoribosyltransferase
MQIVLSENQIKTRVKEMGAEISEHYRGRGTNLLYVIGILRGGFVFTADLVREISIPVEIDFIWASSYGAATHSSGTVSVLKDIDMDIAQRDVLLVEDIVDTGNTMDVMLKHLAQKNPRSVSVCSLLHKPARQIKEVPISFLGFTVEDQFVVGYGLDFDNRFRERRDIVILPENERNPR